jgi:hypothetical protein
MSTYSSNLKIELIGTGEQVGTWGTTTNSNFSNVFEQSIVGRVAVNFATDANKTLSTSDSVASQDFRNVYLNLTSSGSLSATRDLIVPTINKNYVIQNNTTGGQSIRVITAAGTGTTVPNGTTVPVYVDGTNVIQAFDFLPTFNIGTLDLTNIEVTNIKAKDGTASASIADSTGVMTIASSVLTTTDINGGTIDGTTIGGSTAAAGNFTTLGASSTATLNTLSSSGATITGGSINGTTVGASTASTGAFTSLSASGAFSANGGTTLGDASGDALTINSSAVSIPNGLNFDSNTLVIDATNNFVGVGISTPTVPLQIRKAALTGYVSRTPATLILENSGDTELYIASGSSNVGQLRFGDTGGNFRGAISYDHSSDSFLYYTDGSERMRITSAGLVGIGTSSPAYTLDVSGSQRLLRGTSSSTALLHFSDNGGANNAYLSFYNASDAWLYATSKNGTGTIKPIRFATNDFGNSTSGIALAIETNGNVGIGTSSPSNRLTVSGNETTTQKFNAVGNTFGSGAFLNAFTSAGGNDVGFSGYIASQTSNTTNRLWMGVHSPSGSNQGFVGTPDATPLAFWTNSAERMRLDSSGNLGLGVTPSAWLTGYTAQQIKTLSLASGGGGFEFVTSNAFVGTGDVFKYIETRPAVAYRLNNDSGVHAWYNAPSGTAGNNITFTQVMTLDASGRLGIGTTSPAALLHLASVGNTRQRFQNTGTRQWSLGNNSESFTFVDETASAERMRIDSSGNLLVGQTAQFANPTRVCVTASFVGYAARHTSSASGKYFYFGADQSNSFIVYNQDGTGVYLADGGTSWTANSDERVKDIIEPITDATNKVSTLRAVIGKYKTDAEGTRRSFLIAQDVQSVLPEAVNQQNDEIGTLGVQYTDIIPLLVAAIKEQQTIINDLKARIETLESK